MLAVALLQAYITLNALVAVAATIMLMLNTDLGRFKVPVRDPLRLRLAYLLIFAVISLPVIAAFIPKWNLTLPGLDLMLPTSQIWTATSMQELTKAAHAPDAMAVTLAFSATPTRIGLPFLIVFGVFILFMTVAACRFISSIWKLAGIRKSAFRLRQFRSVRVLASEQVSVPFSFWLPFRSYVVLPSLLLQDQEKMQIATAHEIQHHRQGDTKWLYVMHAIKTLCFLNPFTVIMDRVLTEMQEFACDAAVASHPRFSSPAYCRCLLWVAEAAVESKSQAFVGATNMTTGSATHSLRRRVESMLNGPRRYLRMSALAGICILIGTSLVGITLAANSAIRDRRISMTEAQRLAEIARQDSSFPIVVNDLVLAQLNRFLGTPDGRDFMKTSLAQMQGHKEVVASALRQYSLPHELMALPIIESGYQNLPADGNATHGAGIWMFTVETAKNFGLKIDTDKDERLDIALETDAAMRLLSSLHLHLRDWGLAILGYSSGADSAQKAALETGSQDVWELSRAAVHENELSYVAQVMAAVIIMQNPSSLD